jgi:hypothetical protein
MRHMICKSKRYRRGPTVASEMKRRRKVRLARGVGTPRSRGMKRVFALDIGAILLVSSDIRGSGGNSAPENQTG